VMEMIMMKHARLLMKMSSETPLSMKGSLMPCLLSDEFMLPLHLIARYQALLAATVVIVFLIK